MWAIGKRIEMIELQRDRGPFTLKKIRTAQSYLGLAVGFKGLRLH